MSVDEHVMVSEGTQEALGHIESLHDLVSMDKETRQSFWRQSLNAENSFDERLVLGSLAALQYAPYAAIGTLAACMYYFS